MTTSWLGIATLVLFAMIAPVSANELQGVWLFEKEVNTTASGEVVKIPGPAYAGLLIYTPDGYVSANLLPKDRAWKVDDANLEELRQTVGQGSSTGYAGRYEVDTTSRRVTHTPLVSMDPADEGQRLVRAYALGGDVHSVGYVDVRGKETVVCGPLETCWLAEPHGEAGMRAGRWQVVQFQQTRVVSN